MTDEADAAPRIDHPKTVVIIPTYDERENIQSIVPAILREAPWTSVWIVDDNSPDGTGALADELASSDGRVRAYHRPAKAGLGTAYAESFPRAVAEGYEYVVEMDADFSHDPAVLPEMLGQAEQVDLLVGSRYIPGGSTPNWTFPRRAISRIGNIVARVVLGVPVHDATTGYRVFSRKALKSLRLEGIRLQGYGFQVETVFQIHRKGLTIKEYPIQFIDRRQGHSKMSRAIVFEALVHVFRRRLDELFGRANPDMTAPRGEQGLERGPSR